MSSDSQDTKKRIAKNTLFLYLRMFVTMCVGFFTSRIVLQALGLSDYGIYNVMGGVLGMLGYIDALLSGGTSRFLTIALGAGDHKLLKSTFSTAAILAIISALIILILGETIGLWFMNYKLNIPIGRLDAANWVYQFALLSMCLSVIQTPYSASIISHERMGVYAYMSIYDVVMKLLIVYSLYAFDYDKLKLYASLLFGVSLTGFIIHQVYCVRKFEECKFRFIFKKELLKEMFVFSGWNMVASFSGILNNYGINILLNIFFGTIINASRAIALQVSSIVQQFNFNFQMASRPQVMKYYAQGQIAEMSDMIIANARFCTLMLLCLAIPICFNVEGLLLIWLGQVPAFAPDFIILVVIQVLIMSLDYPLGFGIHAVGKMKLPNMTTGIINLMIFPISYVALKFGAGPVASYVIYICVSPLILISDLWILHRYIGFDWKRFVFKSIRPVLLISLLACIVPMILKPLIDNHIWYMSLGSAFVSFLYTAIVCYYLGLNKTQRVRVQTLVIDKIKMK